jgi:hypothetical protein
LGEAVKYFLYIFPKAVQKYRGQKYRASASREKSSSFELGASLVEYGLLVSLIAVVAIGAVKILGQNSSQALIVMACLMEDDPIGCCEAQNVKNAFTTCGPIVTAAPKN